MTTGPTSSGVRNGLSGDYTSDQAFKRDVSDDLRAMKDDAADIGSAAAREARRLAGTARDQAYHFADQRKRGAADTIDDVARMLRNAGTNLEDKANLRGIVDHAATTLEDVSYSVRNKTFVDLYDDAERFARSRPVMTAALTAAAGLLVARFIKSSAERRAYARGFDRAREDGFYRDADYNDYEGYQPRRFR